MTTQINLYKIKVKGKKIKLIQLHTLEMKVVA